MGTLAQLRPFSRLYFAITASWVNVSPSSVLTDEHADQHISSSTLEEDFTINGTIR